MSAIPYLSNIKVNVDCIKINTVTALDHKIVFLFTALQTATVVSEHVKLGSGVNLGSGGGGTARAGITAGVLRRSSPRSNAQLITAIISAVSPRDKGLLAQALIIKHKVVCLPVLWEDLEIKAEGLI